MTWSKRSGLQAIAGAFAGFMLLAAAEAQDIDLADGVTRAEGFEATDTTYIVANPTPIFSNHLIDLQGLLQDEPIGPSTVPARA